MADKLVADCLHVTVHAEYCRMYVLNPESINLNNANETQRHCHRLSIGYLGVTCDGIEINCQRFKSADLHTEMNVKEDDTQLLICVWRMLRPPCKTQIRKSSPKVGKMMLL